MSNSPALKSLLTIAEAAQALRMPTARLVRLARAGKLPCVDLGDDEIRFDPDDLAAWVENKKGTDMLEKLLGSHEMLTKWEEDKAVLATESDVRAEVKAAGERLQEIEAQHAAGLVTDVALQIAMTKHSVASRKLSKINHLKVEMIGRCPDRKLQTKCKRLRNRKREAARAVQDVRQRLEDEQQQRDLTQRNIDERQRSLEDVVPQSDPPDVAIVDWESELALFDATIADLRESLAELQAERDDLDKQIESLKGKMLKA